MVWCVLFSSWDNYTDNNQNHWIPASIESTNMPLCTSRLLLQRLGMKEVKHFVLFFSFLLRIRLFAYSHDESKIKQFIRSRKHFIAEEITDVIYQLISYESMVNIVEGTTNTFNIREILILIFQYPLSHNRVLIDHLSYILEKFIFLTH